MVQTIGMVRHGLRDSFAELMLIMIRSARKINVHTPAEDAIGMLLDVYWI